MFADLIFLHSKGVELFVLADVGANGFAHLLHRVPTADALREFVVDLRFFLNANLLERDFVMNALSAKVFICRVIAVGFVERRGLARFLSAQSLMQLWQRR